MSIHALVLEMKKLLGNVDGWLDKAVVHGADRKFDPSTLLDSRLAPNMFPLRRQFQAACDAAKFAAARAAGKEAPSHPDDEKTLDDMRKRVSAVAAYLDTFTPADFEDVASRTVTTPRWEGKSMTATDYVLEHAQPNFFFHLAMAYAILRHNGVDVGKRDFLGKLSFR
jgi:hypothetical protein